jgi:hypothetical protein
LQRPDWFWPSAKGEPRRQQVSRLAAFSGFASVSGSGAVAPTKSIYNQL